MRAEYEFEDRASIFACHCRRFLSESNCGNILTRTLPPYRPGVSRSAFGAASRGTVFASVTSVIAGTQKYRSRRHASCHHFAQGSGHEAVMSGVVKEGRGDLRPDGRSSPAAARFNGLFETAAGCMRRRGGKRTNELLVKCAASCPLFPPPDMPFNLMRNASSRRISGGAAEAPGTKDIRPRRNTKDCSTISSSDASGVRSISTGHFVISPVTRLRQVGRRNDNAQMCGPEEETQLCMLLTSPNPHR